MKKLLYLFLLFPSAASALTMEAQYPELSPKNYNVSRTGTTIKTISVTLGISGYVWDLTLPEGATINEAVESIARVKHGLVCSDSRDILCIDDICGNPYKGTYWLIKVNGNSQNYSSHSQLQSGDVVELTYTGQTDHQRLEEWFLSSSKGR